MAADITRDTAQAAIDQLRGIAENLPKTDPARLHQLDSHLATVEMVIGYLFDEAETQRKES
jgi:hypothetical protein